MAAWYVVGFAYYAICFTVVYRLAGSGDHVALLATIAVLMIGNAAWNLLFFRKQDLRLSLISYIPYSVVVAGLIIGLWRIDRVSALLFFAYAAYLPYAVAWSYSIMKHNPASSG